MGQAVLSHRCHPVALVVAAEPWLDLCHYRVELVEWAAVEGPMAWLAYVHSLVEKLVAAMFEFGRTFAERENRAVVMRYMNSSQHNGRSLRVLAHSYHRIASSNKALTVAVVQFDHREQGGSSCQLLSQGLAKRSAVHKLFDMEAQGEERLGDPYRCQAHLEGA